MSAVTLVLAGCLVVMIGGAVWDLTSRRIPNLLCAILALAAAAYAYLAGGIDQMAWGLVHGSLALVVGMGLFALGVIGGGDAKLYSAGALAMPLQSGLIYLGWTSLAGFVLLATMFGWARLVSKERRSVQQMRKAEVPYGVAIGAGFYLAMLVSQA